jgi:hypothetical protein
MNMIRRSLICWLFAGVCLTVMPPLEGAQTYTMKAGDNLWKLANTFYGDPTLYPVFLEVNRIDNPRTIPTGTVITIPDVEAMRNIAAERDPAKREHLISTTRKGLSGTPQPRPNQPLRSGTRVNPGSRFSDRPVSLPAKPNVPTAPQAGKTVLITP